MAETPSPAARILSTLGWGVYCASSWTWCVGMFLPAIMLQRHGWPGFLAFALPNVLGCGAFGYVVRTAERSRGLVARHEGMMTTFSLVTIAYHMYFIAFIALVALPTIFEQPWLALVLAGAVFAIGLVASDLPQRAWPIFGVAVYAISAAAFFSVGVAPLGEIAWTGARPPMDLVWLTPTLVFGFLLCPYLDRTFHHALQSSPSRHAFGVFAVTFAAMIVLTCAYAGRIGDTGGLGGLVVAHLFGQSIFTVSAHMRAARQGLERPARQRVRWLILLPLLAAPIALLTVGPRADPLEDGTYIRFLVAYGLVFPAYVLVFMVVLRSRPLVRGSVEGFVYVVLFLGLLYEHGFMLGKPAMLPVALAVLALWTWIAWRRQAAAKARADS